MMEPAYRRKNHRFSWLISCASRILAAPQAWIPNCT